MAWLPLRVLGQDCWGLVVSQLVTSIIMKVNIKTGYTRDLVAYSHCNCLVLLFSSEEILVEVVVLK